MNRKWCIGDSKIDSKHKHYNVIGDITSKNQNVTKIVCVGDVFLENTIIADICCIGDIKIVNGEYGKIKCIGNIYTKNSLLECDKFVLKGSGVVKNLKAHEFIYGVKNSIVFSNVKFNNLYGNIYSDIIKINKRLCANSIDFK